MQKLDSHHLNTEWAFDLGTPQSPVAEGYIQVHENTLYSKELGYGLDVSTSSRDQNGADDLRRDFLLMSNRIFKVDVPNGIYYVQVTTGSLDNSDTTTFTLEGGATFSGKTDAGKFADHSGTVTITDGQLNIAFGAAAYSRTNAIRIIRYPDAPELVLSKVDFNSESSVTLTWDNVLKAQVYQIYRKSETEETFSRIAEATAPLYIDSDVEFGYNYEYQVSAMMDDFESERSNIVNIQFQDDQIQIPLVPDGLKAEGTTASSVDLVWQPTEGATTYYVYRSRFSSSNFERIGVTQTASFKDLTASTHQNLYYQIRAVHAGGMSGVSTTLEVPATFNYVRQMEYLDRGLVAVKNTDGVYVGWRMFGTDPNNVEFDLYRDGQKVNSEPIQSSTNYLDTNGTVNAKYKLHIRNGVGPTETKEVNVWGQQYLSIPIDKPADSVLPSGETYSYYANDASIGDLDGDGEYEIVLKWEAVAHDNSSPGYTTNVYLDAYKLDGTKLWRIDAGRNIRSGAHYTQFLVYDFDGDGKAEIAFKTADGTVDGTGKVIGDSQADYRNSRGYILEGPEFLTVFEGKSGKALDTVNYSPPRGNVEDWGDEYGNRVDRFLAGVAYLDGEHPSMVFARGYYTRAVLAAYDFKEGKLVQRWVFDSKDPGNSSYEGQGNHSLAVADVDDDGFDEIVYGAATIDHDGTGLYSTGWGHGDALHVSDFDPSRPGLEIYKVYEPEDSPRGFGVHDAETGVSVWGIQTGVDTGRGMAADIDPRHLGAEMWANGGLYSAGGELITTETPKSTNFAIWWDGDLLRELFDHNFKRSERYGLPKIEKWNWEAEELNTLYIPSGVRTNNDTKGTPALQADIFGDWREELILPALDSNSLQIHTTTDLTDYRIYTLMHDPTYRLSVAWQNVSYNQPPHPGFYLGEGMNPPPTPNISLVGAQ
ncbi:hypothetical protein ABEW19_30140 [Paenibacillus illinoisensis]|uniref:rhamnogalacturonan lyase family protein n=1 Tax=Paenibacillus illinoisensis TaxID=59845 RepID=UPI003D2BF988